MKVIFLDIDGVLNTENYIMTFFDVCKKLDKEFGEAKALKKDLLRDEFGNHFEPKTVQNLQWIVSETNAKIVISSTWRMSGLKVMQDMFKARDIFGEVVDVTPIEGRDHIEEHIQMYTANHYDSDRENLRGHEIEQWISDNNVDSYVILDDDNDMLDKQLPNFIQTDGYYGLTSRDAKKAISILNK